MDSSDSPLKHDLFDSPEYSFFDFSTPPTDFKCYDAAILTEKEWDIIEKTPYEKEIFEILKKDIDTFEEELYTETDDGQTTYTAYTNDTDQVIYLSPERELVGFCVRTDACPVDDEGQAVWWETVDFLLEDGNLKLIDTTSHVLESPDDYENWSTYLTIESARHALKVIIEEYNNKKQKI